MRLGLKLLAAILAVFYIGSVVNAKDYSATVLVVMRGDMLLVVHNNQPELLRLYGAYCPQLTQDFYKEAKSFTRELVLDKTVSVEPISTPVKGIVLGVVTLKNGEILNQTLVKKGMAWWDSKLASKSPFLPKLERDARDAKVGIWSKPNPTPPWDVTVPEMSPEISEFLYKMDEMDEKLHALAREMKELDTSVRQIRSADDLDAMIDNYNEHVSKWHYMIFVYKNIKTPEHCKEIAQSNIKCIETIWEGLTKMASILNDAKSRDYNVDPTATVCSIKNSAIEMVINIKDAAKNYNTAMENFCKEQHLDPEDWAR